MQRRRMSFVPPSIDDDDCSSGGSAMQWVRDHPFSIHEPTKRQGAAYIEALREWIFKLERCCYHLSKERSYWRREAIENNERILMINECILPHYVSTIRAYKSEPVLSLYAQDDEYQEYRVHKKRQAKFNHLPHDVILHITTWMHPTDHIHLARCSAVVRRELISLLLVSQPYGMLYNFGGCDVGSDAFLTCGCPGSFYNLVKRDPETGKLVANTYENEGEPWETPHPACGTVENNCMMTWTRLFGVVRIVSTAIKHDVPRREGDVTQHRSRVGLLLHVDEDFDTNQYKREAWVCSYNLPTD